MPDFKSLRNKRLRILWIVLGALLLVSVAPLWLYHREVLKLSESKLEDTERVQQQEIARSIAGEILQFQTNTQAELLTQRQFMALTGMLDNVDEPTHSPQVSRMLQNFIESNPNILFVTAVNWQARGESAGSVRADQDQRYQRLARQLLAWGGRSAAGNCREMAIPTLFLPSENSRFA